MQNLSEQLTWLAFDAAKKADPSALPETDRTEKDLGELVGVKVGAGEVKHYGYFAFGSCEQLGRQRRSLLREFRSDLGLDLSGDAFGETVVSMGQMFLHKGWKDCSAPAFIFGTDLYIMPNVALGRDEIRRREQQSRISRFASGRRHKVPLAFSANTDEPPLELDPGKFGFALPGEKVGKLHRTTRRRKLFDRRARPVPDSGDFVECLTPATPEEDAMLGLGRQVSDEFVMDHDTELDYLAFRGSYPKLPLQGERPQYLRLKMLMFFRLVQMDEEGEQARVDQFNISFDENGRRPINLNNLGRDFNNLV